MIKQLFETKLTDIRSTDVEGVGTLRYEDEETVYRWVKNRNATAIAADQPVCYDVGNVGSSALFQSINMPVSADLMMAAGIAMATMGISGAVCYGWVKVQGYHVTAAIRTPKTAVIAVGSEMICENTAAVLGFSVAPGTAPIYSKHFICLEAVATDGTGTAATTADIYIKCI